MISITTEHLEELKEFLEKMGCKIHTSSSRHWQTEGEIEYPGRNGEIHSATILRRDGLGRIDPTTYEVKIRSTPGFEQKLLVKARKWAIAVIGKGTVKPLKVSYYTSPDPERLKKEEESLKKVLKRRV